MKRKDGFTLLELITVLLIVAVLAAITVPLISKIVRRAEHIKRVTAAIKKISENRAESYDTGVAIIEGLWYTPFSCEPHTIVVGDETIEVQSFYVIRKSNGSRR